MSISDGLFNLAEVKVVGISGIHGIGVNRLQFALELNVAATPDYSATISNPLCFVFASRTQSDASLPIGHAIAETCWFRQTSQYAGREGFSLFLYLTGELLAQLENMRGGGSFFFRLDLHAQVNGKNGLQRSFEQLWFEANLSNWSRVLRDLGQLDLLLLAVELPIDGVSAELKVAVDQIKEAHCDLVAGRYDSVVSLSTFRHWSMRLKVGRSLCAPKSVRHCWWLRKIKSERPHVLSWHSKS